MRRLVLLALISLVAVPTAGAGVPRVVPHLPTREDKSLSAALARAGSSFHGWAALFVEDLDTGRYAGWNENVTFPAASTVKLGVIAEAIRRYGFGPSSPVDRDLRAIGQWSSNEAANRLFALVGGAGPTQEALRRLGMFSSTFPAPYLLESELKGRRTPSAVAPPRVTWRVTTARDLARALFRLQAAAVGQRWAIRVTALSAPAARAALGYLALASPSTSLLTYPAASRHIEKDGWLDDIRATAAIAYLRHGSRIVVVLTYRPGISHAEARALGARVSALAFRSYR
jgi:beta-lactamase class A